MTMKLNPVPLFQIQIQDHFWSKHTELVEQVIIPYQWEIINDRVLGAQSSHCLENFRIAAGWKEGEYYGAVFQDTDIAKWLEAVGYSLTTHKNEQLEQLADEVIELLEAAQQPDGYMDTYFIVKEPDKKWKNLCEGHELYTAGHMMEAAVAYYQGTGKRKFLDCVIRLADLICDTFGPEAGKLHGYPGHQEIEIGFIRLAGITGEQNYWDMAKYFLDVRGQGVNYFLMEQKQPGYKPLFPEFADYDPRYSQSHLPVREQETAEGHAVRAVYMYCAMADIACEYEDERLMQACRKLWDNIVQKRMYITGGIGSSGFLERFTTDYDLPNDGNYSETCASIGMALFGLRMANITRESKYADIVELELYNNILAGIALDGKSFFYVNPLEIKPENCIPHTSRNHVKASRQKWFGVACCPPNVARTLASLGQYIYGVWGQEVYLHLFISNKAEVETDGQKFKMEVVSEFPWEGRVTVQLTGVSKRTVFCFRIPEYAGNYRLELDGKATDYKAAMGYAKIAVEQDATIVITFDMAVQFLRANPRVSADIGKAAVKRGAIVYCFEEVDNGKNLSAIYLDTQHKPEEVYCDSLGKILQMKLKGKRLINEVDGLYSEYTPKFREVTCNAVPYACWNNRGIGEMSVWMNAVLP